MIRVVCFAASVLVTAFIFRAQAAPPPAAQRLLVSGVSMAPPLPNWKLVEIPGMPEGMDRMETHALGQGTRLIMPRFESAARVCQNEKLALKRRGIKLTPIADLPKGKFACSFTATAADQVTQLAVMDTSRRITKKKRFQVAAVFVQTRRVPVRELASPSDVSAKSFLDWTAGAAKLESIR